MNRRLLSVPVIAAAGLVFTAIARAEAPATQPADDNVARILKLADPDIEALKKLDTSKVNLDETELATKTMAIMALNDVLSLHIERAKMRVGLLEDFMEVKGLTEAFSQDASVVPETPTRSYEECLKIAVVLVQSPEGQDDYDKQVKGVKPEMLQRVYRSYYTLAEKNYGECLYARFRVQELGSYVDSKGLLNEFIAWAKDEKGRRQKARKEEVNQIIAKNKAEQEIARGKRMEAAQRDKDRRHEYLMKKMEYSYELRRDNNRNNYYYVH